MKKKFVSSGFTLVEILIGLAISASIFIVAASLVTSLFGTSTKSRQVEVLEQVKNDLQIDLGNTTRWAGNISFIGGELAADDTKYYLQSGRIYKNGEPLTPADVEVLSFDVLKFITPSDAVDLETGIGLTAQYYSGKKFKTLKLTQVDFDVDYNWAGEAPNSLLGSDNFSVRWSGQVEAPYDGQYTFYTLSDDGVRLWVNNELIIDNWTDHSASTNNGKIKLDANKRYDIKLEYYEAVGDAVITLSWSHPKISKEVVPTFRLYPSSSAASIEILIAFRYKNNTSLNDTLRLILSPRGGIVGAIEPAPTPTPTAKPTLPPTPTSEPTATLKPTETPVPTPTPVKTATPKPTQKPTPKPTPTPTPSPKPLR